MSSGDSLLLEQYIRETQLDKGAMAEHSRCQLWNIISLAATMKRDISPKSIKVQSEASFLIVAADSASRL